MASQQLAKVLEIIKSQPSKPGVSVERMRAGMEKALEKRPVPREQIDEAVSRIVHQVRSLGDREITARAIGELVMEELRHLDEVAYVRFASVYRHFEDVEAFHDEIQRLRATRRAAHSHGRSHKGAGDANREQLPLLPAESGGGSPSSSGGKK